MDADSLCRSKLSAAGASEARSWLSADDRRTLGEHDSGGSMEIVESLYRRGARKVVAVDIEDYGDCQTSDALVVILPDDPSQRARVFDFQNHYESEFDPAPDEGQEYLFLYKFKGELDEGD